MVVKYILILALYCTTNITSNTYPVPENVEGLLFYIQRSFNKNTIIYKANFDADGILNSSQPVKACWIMYEDGERMENLTLMERKYAYGMISEPCKNASNTYWLKLVSQNELPLRIVQRAPFKASVIISRGDTAYHLNHIFIKANNDAFWPKINAIDLYMRRDDEGELFKETLMIEK